jgi:hypothetical protein
LRDYFQSETIGKIHRNDIQITASSPSLVVFIVIDSYPFFTTFTTPLGSRPVPGHPTIEKKHYIQVTHDTIFTINVDEEVDPIMYPVIDAYLFSKTSFSV